MGGNGAEAGRVWKEVCAWVLGTCGAEGCGELVARRGAGYAYSAGGHDEEEVMGEVEVDWVPHC